MAGFRVSVEQSLSADGVTIELRNYAVISRKIHAEPRASSYLCDLALSPRPDAVFSHKGSQTKLGPILLIPPWYPLSGHLALGSHRSLACIIDEKKFSSLAGSIIPAELPAEILLNIRDNYLERALSRLLHEVLNPGFASAIVAEAVTTTIIVDLVRYFSHAKETLEAGNELMDHHHLARIYDIIETHDGPGLTVSALAEACGMSARHLLRLFRNTTGMTVTAYISELRVKRAIRLLSETHLPNKEIAYRVGFSSSSTFSDAFRKRMGIAPSLFRCRAFA